VSSNSYVDFVSDEYFKRCVKNVCDSFDSVSNELVPEELHKHGIDPIKMSFDMYKLKQGLKSWNEKEKIRQDDKTINNKIGEFHQMLLGGVDGWTDLGIGDESHLDLRKNDNTVFMELKNKENTVNDDSKKQVRSKLEAALNANPGATCYWGYVVAENGKSQDKVWWPYINANPHVENENIRRISGKEIYRLVTGDGDNLEKVWRALPLAIKNVCHSDFQLSEADQTAFDQLFEKAFNK